MTNVEAIVGQSSAGRPGSHLIWGGKKNVRAPKGEALRFNFLADRPWLVEFDARLLTEHLANIAAKTIYDSIVAKEDPASGRTLPSPKRRPGGTRMFRTGKFIRSITRSKVTGNAKRARSMVKSAKKYRGAVRSEFGRGHHYFRVDGRIGAAMAQGLDDFVFLGLAGRMRAPQVRAVKAYQLL